MMGRWSMAVLCLFLLAACACAAHAETALRADFAIRGCVNPTPVAVAIDIKPGSEVNPINLKSRGVTPVAVLSSGCFDATEVDPATVLLAGATVAVRGNGGRYQAEEKDVDGDGRADLLLKVETEEFVPELVAWGCARLTGSTYCGICVEGWDCVTVVPHDVPPGHWASAEIVGCLAAGVVTGYPDGTYQPGAPVSRGQMATFIARALSSGDEGVPAGPANSSFPDVSQDHWAYKYVEHVVGAGVAEGYPDGQYKPTALLDRAQLAVYVARALTGGEEGVPGPTSGSRFADVPEGFWADRHIAYCAQRGVVQGFEDGLYHPGEQVTRDQMAVYVARAFDLPG